MTLLLALFLAVAPLTETTQRLYAARDVAALQTVCQSAEAVEDDLLCRYRLYPLTEDEEYLDHLPATLDDASPRALALLAGLWGYKAARAPLHKLPTYGMRADRLIREARAAAPDDPFVLLIEGQSLLFKPAFAGGDRRAALVRFRHLHRVAAQSPRCGVSVVEAELWTWYAMEKLGDPGADALRQRMLAAQPPRLYREFLERPL